MTSPDDILITGVGVASPIGIGREQFWASLMEGVSGVRTVEVLRGSEFPVGFGGEVLDFEPKKYVKPRKSLKVMCREVQMGFAAATLALDDASIDSTSLDPDRVGVIYGTEMLYCDVETLAETYRASLEDGVFEYELFGDATHAKIYPLWMLMFLPNMTACHVGISLDARGPNNSVVAGEASGLLALIEAATVMQRGLADVMIVGGVGNRLNATPLAFRGPADLSRRNDNPAAACRPFDADRDGLVNGQGAAALVLETRRHAESRGSTGNIRIAGYGTAYEDCVDDREPRGEGMEQALRAAVSNAGAAGEQIDHLNAHGLSTVAVDRAEAKAIRNVLGDVPVTAPKSFFGHLGAGSATVEFVASILALRHGQVPPTLNYETPDPECPVEVIHGGPRKLERSAAVKLSHSGHGQAAAVVVASED